MSDNETIQESLFSPISSDVLVAKDKNEELSNNKNIDQENEIQENIVDKIITVQKNIKSLKQNKVKDPVIKKNLKENNIQSQRQSQRQSQSKSTNVNVKDDYYDNVQSNLNKLISDKNNKSLSELIGRINNLEKAYYLSPMFHQPLKTPSSLAKGTKSGQKSGQKSGSGSQSQRKKEITKNTSTRKGKYYDLDSDCPDSEPRQPEEQESSESEQESDKDSELEQKILPKSKKLIKLDRKKANDLPSKEKSGQKIKELCNIFAPIHI